ncbi:uncharacterized protein Z518_06646 [Rhinocladiella mackenziei CBS 650.93]|uniref:Uncharacterized protein n=1 Tax=Rhinocladiella mackenziei CBS 650.93 TaxID=1442369 RepID=A0A0D2IIH9_9EURO|nr:uncharacterized protein Z518_06646 [Rhinocladiella mackenziei CBS 650.93]KIX03096.1 hypothetical protein Z518_06646 [Rhinocladiella mackenziei CBS 650.93]
MAPEGARERGMHRYAHYWIRHRVLMLISKAGIISPGSRHSSPPILNERLISLLASQITGTDRDKALTAFAQLGCLRLNAKRGVVTLLDRTKQYIIAEATNPSLF